MWSFSEGSKWLLKKLWDLNNKKIVGYKRFLEKSAMYFMTNINVKI